MKNYNRCKKHCKEHETLTYETPASETPVNETPASETPASEICINELSIGTPSFSCQGVRRFGKGRGPNRRKYIPDVHPQSPGSQGKGVKTGRDRDIPGYFANAWIWTVYSPCSVYAESLFVKPAFERAFRPDDGGGPAADGTDAGKSVQPSSGQPAGPAPGQRH